jgi:hypothetical protein
MRFPRVTQEAAMVDPETGPEIWKAEEVMWTGGTDAFQRRMGPVCVMTFPGIGVLERDEILPTLAVAPRWSHIDMKEKHLAETDGMIVLGYRAYAIRDGDAPYNAFCSSTWISTPEGWRIVQHQHTPIH